MCHNDHAVLRPFLLIQALPVFPVKLYIQAKASPWLILLATLVLWHCHCEFWFIQFIIEGAAQTNNPAVGIIYDRTK